MSIPHPAGPPQAPPSTFPDPIPGVIDFGTVNILAGASGVGKTCLLATVLTQLGKGEDVFGRRVNKPPAIGMICADRSVRTTRHWLKAAGWEGHDSQGDIRLYALAEDPSFNPVRLRNKIQLVSVLEELIKRLDLPPGSLVIVDPITLFLGNPNDYQQCAISCIEIRRLCLKLQITMIGTAHASKQLADKKAQYKRLQDRILGSTAQLGYGDTQMYLASPEETNEKHYTFLWHPHTDIPEVFPLGRAKGGLFVDYNASEAGTNERKILAAITETDEGTGFAEILIASEVSKPTVHRYLQELLRDGRIVKVGHGRYKKVPPS